MKRFLVTMVLVPSLALAAEAGAAKSEGKSDDPMAQWVPPKVKNAEKDKKEILSLVRSMENAAKTGNLDAAAALVDFPVTMITDDSKGEAMGEAWDRDRWVEVMKPFYENPKKDMKVTHKPQIFLLSDSLAAVDDTCTMTQGGKTMTSRNSMFLVRRDGKWLVKTMAEGGWGDMMAESKGASAGRTEPSSQGTGSSAGEPSSTSGSASEPASPTTGSGASEPASPTTGSGATQPQEPATGSGTSQPQEPTTGSGASQPAEPATK